MSEVDRRIDGWIVDRWIVNRWDTGNCKDEYKGLNSDNILIGHLRVLILRQEELPTRGLVVTVLMDPCTVFTFTGPRRGLDDLIFGTLPNFYSVGPLRLSTSPKSRYRRP